MSHRPSHPLLPELQWLEQLIERGHPHLQAREAQRVHMPGGPSFPVHAITLGNPDPALPAVGYFGGVHGLERIGAEVVIVSRIPGATVRIKRAEVTFSRHLRGP